MTISSRQVSNSSSATAHRTGASIGDSGDITLESQKIIVREGAMITAEGDSGFAGGDVTLDADSKTLAQIIVDNATIKGASIALQADSSHATISVYETRWEQLRPIFRLLMVRLWLRMTISLLKQLPRRTGQAIQAASWWPLMPGKLSAALILMIPR